MSLLAHAAILTLVVLNLALGATVVDDVAGRWPSVGFEFAVILGYVLLVLQWQPWRRPDRDDG